MRSRKVIEMTAALSRVRGQNAVTAADLPALIQTSTRVSGIDSGATSSRRREGAAVPVRRRAPRFPDLHETADKSSREAAHGTK